MIVPSIPIKPLWRVAVLSSALLLLTTSAAFSALADSRSDVPPSSTTEEPAPQGSQLEATCQDHPLQMAEGSNSCEIVSCGMGIKDTCKISCPAGKTPKCSCDCLKNFGPMCTEYKANCKCE